MLIDKGMSDVIVVKSVRKDGASVGVFNVELVRRLQD